MARSIKTPAAKAKIAKTMHEWGKGTLHSGSKAGPKVTDQKQAVAIALNQARNPSRGDKRAPFARTGRT